MAIHCVNHKSVTVKDLASELGVNPLVAAAKVAIWQEKNGLDSFPTAEDLKFSENIVSQKVLESKNNLNKDSNIFTNKINFNNLKGSKKNELDWNEPKITSTIKESNYSNENNRVLFNNQQGRITVDEILNNILNNYNNLSPVGKELLEKSRRLIGRTGAKFQFVSESTMSDENTVMQINSDTNTIQANRQRLSKFTTDEVVETFLHELAHAQTLQALLNPITFEEKQFKKSIDEMYSKYKSLSNSSKSYGFENEKEFVSEIYANKVFRDELRALDEENNTSYWKKFIESLRRLFGLAKTKETDNLIEEIIDYVQQDRRDYRGTNLQRTLFANKKTAKSKIETVEDRVNRTLDKAKDNLDNLLKLSKKYKKQNEDKGAKFESHIQDLITEINKVDGLNQWKGVAVYVKSMLSTIKQLENRLKSEDLSQENGLEMIDLYRTYLSSYDLVDDVKKLITSLKKDNIDEIGEDIVDEIRSSITEAIGRHDVLESDFNTKLADILKTQLNTLNYLPQVENKWREKLAKEYKNSGITGVGKDEWISKQMNGQYKDEIQEDVDNAISELLTGIGTDISWAGQMFGDVINNNSRLVSIVANLITQAREKIIEQTREGDFKESKLFEALVKDRGTSKPSELYKNIYDKDSTGYTVFKGEYSVKFKEAYEKILNEVQVEQSNSDKTIAVQDINLKSVREDKKTISLRKIGDHNYKVNDILDVSVKGKNTGVKVQVNNIVRFSNFKKLSQERKDKFAQMMGNYTSFDDFLNKNKYLNEKETFSKKFPEIFNFINGIGSLDLIEYTKVSEDSAKYNNFVKRNQTIKKWLKENTVTKKGITKPIDKWKNDLSKLSKAEKDALNYFIETTKKTDEQTHGIQSLISEFRGAIYYDLPAVTKSDEERVIEGNLKGLVKDKIKDLTEIRPDDIGYQEQRLDSKGNSIHYLRVHYRGNLTPDQQSYDAFTINRLNRINGINYQEKENIALQVEAIKTIAKNKEYYIKTKGGESVLNKYATRVKEATTSSKISNEAQMIENIIEKNLYDILHIQYDKLGPIDVNKVISTANGWVASVGLSLNTFSAAANIVNAQAQIFLERVAGNHLTKGSVKKAHDIYTKDFANILGDYSRPIKQSFVNQVNQMFDTFGGFTVKQQDYIKNTIAKTAVNFESLQFMHEGGEHYVQSIMVMATLDSIKVINDNNDYIDKNGKVVEKDKAASVLDMLTKDEDGIVRLDDKVVYTNRSFNTKLKEGGKEQIMLFVKKKLFDTMGNYDSNMQPEAYRHWWGKMILLFRRYLIPQAVARFRGITKAWVKEEDLTEDDIHFNNALRTTEEGSYVSTLRFLRHTIYPALKQLKFDIISSNWNELSDDKKANIKRTIVELTLTGAILPLVGMMAAGAAGDDDKKWLWTVAFLSRRLESELSQFRDPREATKITKSPIPSLRIIEQTLDVVEYILPWNWSEINDRYESGKNKGELKIQRKTEKLIPILSKVDVTSEELYNALNSRWGK
jgi:hypothetical protein